MDKTVKINLGGSLFQIDEDAYRILRDYLQAIDTRLRNVAGAAETLEDIETRIAEIFLSQKSTAGIISRENVEAMMSIIGKPEDFETDEDDLIPPPLFREDKRLYRNPDDSIIGGVCGGIGAFLNTDPVWFRILFIVTALFFGIGFFVYLGLWIALPSAPTGTSRTVMHRRQRSSSSGSVPPRQTQGTYAGSNVGNAFNEVFRALGRVFFIIVRVFLVIIGVSFVLTGFLAMVTFIMVFFFRYPGYFSTEAFGLNLFYLPDFLSYIVSPAVAPWIIVLLSLAIILPLLALIYWGVRMIFWFRARDGVIGLICLVLWVISIAALSLILFNEGVSFAETSKTSSVEIIENPPEKLYIICDNSIDELRFDKDISVHDENYRLYFRDDDRNLYVNTQLSISTSNDSSLRVEIRKRSAGRSKSDARKKTETLIYNYSISGDSILIDEFFTIPEGSKWSCDNVGVIIYIPEGKLVQFDSVSENMFRQNYYFHHDFDSKSVSGGDKTWIMTGEGLRMPGKE